MSVLSKRFFTAISIVLVVALTASVAIAAPAVVTDVPKDHWAYEAVTLLVNKGYMGVYESGQFRGDDNVSRYLLAFVAARLLRDRRIRGRRRSIAGGRFGRRLLEIGNIRDRRCPRVRGSGSSPGGVAEVGPCRDGAHRPPASGTDVLEVRNGTRIGLARLLRTHAGYPESAS